MLIPITYECGCAEELEDEGDLYALFITDPDRLPLELDEPCYTCAIEAWRQLQNQKSFKASV